MSTLTGTLRNIWEAFFPAHPTPTEQATNTVLLVLFALTIAILVWQEVSNRRRQREVRRSLMDATPVSAAEFLENWRIGKRGSGLGYGGTDEAGCYVIMTDPVYDEAGEVSYEAVYVGQSIHVAQRVRAHLTGHGNGDVYADVRAGKPVEVRMVRCAPSDLNATERSLIAAFDATSSYNRTRGGSKSR